MLVGLGLGGELAGRREWAQGDGGLRAAGVGFGAEGRDLVMVGLRLAVEFRDGLPLISPPCRASSPHASSLANGSDGGSGDGRLRLGGELLVLGLGLDMLGTWEM